MNAFQSYINGAVLAYKLNCSQISSMIKDFEGKDAETFDFRKYDDDLFFKVKGRRSL